MIKAGLKIGDPIEVIPLASNAVAYKYGDKQVCIIYTWNIKKLTNHQ